MYFATRDRILPTTITGSLPRPHWYTARLGDRVISATVKSAVGRLKQLQKRLADEKKKR